MLINDNISIYSSLFHEEAIGPLSFAGSNALKVRKLLSEFRLSSRGENDIVKPKEQANLYAPIRFTSAPYRTLPAGLINVIPYEWVTSDQCAMYGSP